MYGGPGVDYLDLRQGADWADAGAGNDWVYLRNDGKRDVVFCGLDNDHVVYINAEDSHDQLHGCEHIDVQ